MRLEAGDRNSGSIGSDNGFRADQGVEIGVETGLRLHRLRHILDHDSGILHRLGEAFGVEHAATPILDAEGVKCAGYRPLQRLRAVDRGRSNIMGDDGMAAPRQSRRDPGTHGSHADHRNAHGPSLLFLPVVRPRQRETPGRHVPRVPETAGAPRVERLGSRRGPVFRPVMAFMRPGLHSGDPELLPNSRLATPLGRRADEPPDETRRIAVRDVPACPCHPVSVDEYRDHSGQVLANPYRHPRVAGPPVAILMFPECTGSCAMETEPSRRMPVRSGPAAGPCQPPRSV